MPNFTGAPSGYFNQTFTVEYTIPGSLDGSTLVPFFIMAPSENGDPQQIHRPEVEGNAGLFNVDYQVSDFNRRGVIGTRLIHQIWLVSPVVGDAGAEIQVVDAVDGAPIVQEVVVSLAGLDTYYRTVPPVEIPQGSLLRITGFTNPGPEPIKLRLTIQYVEDLVEAALALCTCQGGTGEVTVQDDGVEIGETTIFNFIGAGVTVTADPGNNRIDINIPGGGGGGLVLCADTPEAIEAGSAGAVGVSTEASPCDHEHPVPVAAPATVTGATNAEGVATTLVRSDHQHRLEVAVQDDAAAIGARPTLNFTGAGVTVTDDGGNDRVNIAISGGATAGGTPEPLDVGQVGAAGVSLDYARVDHDHAVPAGTPVTVGQANSAGVATTFARSDHVHRTLVEVEASGVFVGARPTLNFTGPGAPTITVDVPGDDIELNFAGGAAASWEDTLVAGQISGGTDPVISSGDTLRGVDSAAPGTSGTTLPMRGGNYTGAGAGTETGGAVTISGGDSNATGAGAQPQTILRGGDQTGSGGQTGGDVLIRGGDKTGPSRGGNIVVRGGNSDDAASLGSTAEFAAGTISNSGNTAGDASLHGGDTLIGSGLGNGQGGFVLVRGGDAPIAGSIRNASGGNANIRGGNYRVGVAGVTASAGGVFIRSGQPDTPVSPTGGVTGDIRITTNANGLIGDMASVSTTLTGTGDITIDTTGPGATANNSGNITIQTGNVAGATGNDPGEISIISGSMNQTAQSNVGGANIAVTAGNSVGNASSPGGSITLTGGSQTDADTNANSPGGSVNLVAGNSAKSAATSGAGGVGLVGGTATGAAGPGGDISLLAGNNTAAAGTARGGNVSITAGGATAGGSSGAGGTVTLTAGAAAGSGAGAGGTVTITAGAATNAAGSGVGGSVNITAANAAGSGNAGSITLQAGLSNTGIDGNVNSFTHTEASVRLRTQTTGAGSENEAKTLNSPGFLVSGSSTATVVVLDTVAVDGRNTKIQVEVTATDAAIAADQSSTIIIQSAGRAAGTVVLFPAHMADKQVIGGGGSFSNNVIFSLFVSGNDVVLLATNTDPADATGNLTVRWWRQEGGFT